MRVMAPYISSIGSHNFFWKKLWLLIFIQVSTVFSLTNEDAQENAFEFSKDLPRKAFEQINNFKSDDMLPLEDKGKTFDPKTAKNQTLEGKRPPSVLDFLESREVLDNTSSIHVDDNEQFIQEEQYDIDPNGTYIEICKESVSPIEFSLIRCLRAENVYVQENKKNKKQCLGHSKEYKVKRGKGRKEAENERKRLLRDSTIESYHVTYKDRGRFHRDKVKASWKHYDNASTCHHSKIVEVDPQKKVIIQGETWIYDNSSLYELTKSPDCSLIKKTCLDNRPRVVDGQILEKCFVEKLDYLWQPPKASGCQFLRSELCDLKSSQCLLQGPFGCSVWERTFQCYRKLTKKEGSNQVDNSLIPGSWDTEYEPNGNFGDVVTKLSLFREMDSDLKNSETYDIEGFEFFSGNSFRCFVNELPDFTYDCCNKMGGPSNEVLISKCDSEELALYDLKERGQCHYIGSKNENIAGIRTSKRHVYCCFSSKLARVFQEKVRKEIGIGWGSPENPNCQGFKREEIAKADMKKLDLTEAFDDSKVDVGERLERVTKKLQGSLAQ